jgi:5'-nucleotidase
VRILVTNDDGVHAPGLAAITRALARWSEEAAPGQREVVVVAPLTNYSGAGAAVGTVYEREAIAYRAAHIPGAEDIAVYGLDASPALSVIVGSLGAFGPRPDLIVSGINLGVNVGRSVLHSGTVGAVLTGAQLGVSGLAVSMRSNTTVQHWETPARAAVALLPTLTEAPVGTVFNLNVPSLPWEELRGIRRGRISTAGVIKEAADRAGTSGGPSSRFSGGPSGGGDDQEGEIVLTLGGAVPALGDLPEGEPEEDGSLVAAGFACLTPLVGVREQHGEETEDLVRRALEAVAGGPDPEVVVRRS